MFVKFKKCFSDAKQLLRLAVLIICICVSCYQLADCFYKIKYPPISTHYSFAFDSLKYPPITICRHPGFKTHLFKKYGLTQNEICIGSTWDKFNFSTYTLQEFFEETTYDLDEVIIVSALDKLPQGSEISSLYTLTYGRCFTFTPKEISTNWGPDYGYAFIMKFDKTVTTKMALDSSAEGFHIFIQDEFDQFSEKSPKATMFNEYFFVQVENHVNINLKINKYNQLCSSNNLCNTEPNYSRSKCIEEDLNKRITEDVGCSTPWVPNDNLPQCNTSNQTTCVVQFSQPGVSLDRYLEKPSCALKCNITTYTPYLQSIRELPVGSEYTAVKIYLSTQLYTLMEEIVGYDWNAFLADLGGSLGFLLGLSVLSIITIFEQMINTAVKLKKSKMNSVELNNEKNVEEPAQERFKNSFTKNVNNDEALGLKY